jgi:hypothetical protein
MDNSPPTGQQGQLSRHVFLWSALALVVVVFCIYFGPQAITYWRLRPATFRSADISPRGWNSVPHPLADAMVSHADGTRLSYYGCTFEVPWKDIDKERNEGRWVEVHFRKGQTLTFYNPEFFDWEPINSYAGRIDPLMGHDYFRVAFGTGLNKSRYEQFQAVASTTPSQFSPFHSHREFARILTLLEIKGLWFEHNVAAPDIFSFERIDYRGFESSGLSHDWQRVVLDFFDKSDRHSFAIRVEVDSHSGERLTQPEINRVIQTFGVTSSFELNQSPKAIQPTQIGSR